MFMVNIFECHCVDGEDVKMKSKDDGQRVNMVRNN